MLQSYDVHNSSSITTAPFPSQLKLLQDMEDPLPDATVYRKLIGKLNFLLHTRPNLSFSVQYLSQFNKTPSHAHYKASLHVLQYLKGNTHQPLYFNNTSPFKLDSCIL